VRPEGLGKWKKFTSSDLEPTTFQLAAVPTLPHTPNSPVLLLKIIIEFKEELKGLFSSVTKYKD
jgi:hypothetical protein